MRVNTSFIVRIDQVLQGYGTTNTGNLSHTCFGDPLKFAEALEINVNLVNQIALILKLLQSKEELILDKFKKLRKETYKLYYDIYPWARMCPTVCKLLKHSSDIIEKLQLPIAFYSEDASESWHKIYEKNLLCHSRQVSRKDQISDKFKRAEHLLHPLISLMYLGNRLRGQIRHAIINEISKYLKCR